MSENINTEISQNEKIITRTPVWMYVIIALLIAVIIGLGIFAKSLSNSVSTLEKTVYDLTHQTQVYIYNDSENGITFKLNDKEYHTKQRHEAITLPYGKYDLIIGGKVVESFEITEKSKDAIINVSKTDFVKVSKFLTKEENVPEWYESKVDELTKISPRNTIKIDENTTYTGPYELIRNKYYIEKTWDYQPWEKSTHKFFFETKDYTLTSDLWTLPGFVNNFYSEEEKTELEERETTEVSE